MKEVTVTELRRNLQSFLAKASGGQRVRVTVYGRVIAELSPPSPDLDRAKRARQQLRRSVRKFTDPIASAFDSCEGDMNR